MAHPGCPDAAVGRFNTQHRCTGLGQFCYPIPGNGTHGFLPRWDIRRPGAIYPTTAAAPSVRALLCSRPLPGIILFPPERNPTAVIPFMGQRCTCTGALRGRAIFYPQLQLRKVRKTLRVCMRWIYNQIPPPTDSKRFLTSTAACSLLAFWNGLLMADGYLQKNPPLASFIHRHQIVIHRKSHIYPHIPHYPTSKEVLCFLRS